LSVLNPLIVKCNSLLRILQDKPRRFSVIDLYKNYNTLPVDLLYKLFTLKLMHCYIYDKSRLPVVIVNMFSTNCNVHDHNTRARYDVYIDSHLSTKSISFVGPVLWSKLSKGVRDCCSRIIFLNMCKDLLISKELI